MRRALYFFLFFLLFLGLRSYSRWSQALLWAEDAPLFLGESLRHGPGVLFESYRGYFHFLPRLIAWLSLTLFPLKYFAVATNFFGLLIFCGVLAQIASLEFLFPSFLIAIGLSFVPGLGEVFSNPTNLHWVLTFSVGLLGLKKENLNPWNLLWIALCAASAGETIVFLPLFIYRAFESSALTRKKENLIAGLILFGWALLNFSVRDPNGEAQSLDFHLLLKSFTHTLINYVSLQPLVGDHLTEIFSQKLDFLFWSLGLGGLCFLTYTSVQDKKARQLQIYFLCSLGAVALMWIVRRDAANFFALMNREVYFSWLRYSFLLGAASFLLWSRAIFFKFGKKALYGFVGLYVILAFYRIEIKKPMDRPSFKSQIENLQIESCEGETKILTYPPSWSVDIPNKNLCPN